MPRILAGSFLIAHGLVNVAIWLPRTKDAPFDVNRSPLFGDVRGPALSTAIVAAILLILGGITPARCDLTASGSIGPTSPGPSTDLSLRMRLVWE